MAKQIKSYFELVAAADAELAAKQLKVFESLFKRGVTKADVLAVVNQWRNEQSTIDFFGTPQFHARTELGWFARSDTRASRKVLRKPNADQDKILNANPRKAKKDERQPSMF
jgi:hypothetical protein